MTKHERLLELASQIKEPLFNELGSWMGCYEVDVATADGASIMSVQDGTNGSVDGPVVIPAELHGRIREAAKTKSGDRSALEEEWSAIGSEIEFDDVVAMVEAGAEPGVAYYKLHGGDDLVFGTDPDKIENEWLLSLVDGVLEWASWEEMDEDELEERLEGFGLTVEEGEYDEDEADDEDEDEDEDEADDEDDDSPES